MDIQQSGPSMLRHFSDRESMWWYLNMISKDQSRFLSVIIIDRVERLRTLRRAYGAQLSPGDHLTRARDRARQRSLLVKGRW
jgi:hypothetical protein